MDNLWLESVSSLLRIYCNDLQSIRPSNQLVPVNGVTINRTGPHQARTGPEMMTNYFTSTTNKTA